MKYITYDNEARIFTLKTKNSMYQMKIGNYDILIHLYYGANIGDANTDYRLIPMDRGFSGNPYEAGDDRTFSLDTLPQEYSGYGGGDYRINSLEVEHTDGSDAVQLRYGSYEMREGKYQLEGLPCMFARENDEAETLIITLYDQLSGLKVNLLYGVFYDLDIITRAVKLENSGDNPVNIHRAMSMGMDYMHKHMDLMHFYGRHTMERLTERHPLHHGCQSIESKRGMSSHQHNPFVILCDKTTSENHGNAYGYALCYSGNFKCEIEVDQMEQTRLVMGIHPYHFNFKLEKGDTFDTPEVIMAYSDDGLGTLSRTLQDAYRTNLIRSKYVYQPRPILVNNWEATYFNFNEEKLYNIAKNAKDLGLDMFVLDDGWFGKRDNDVSGLGDWVVNEEKIRGGLPALVRKIRGLGLKFGLWIEPEMISEDSDLYRNHPDWVLAVPNRSMTRSRFQLNLDITREEVRDYVMNQIFDVIDSCGIDYIKWDMNRCVDNVFSQALPVERQGEVFHRYMLGVYDMMERMVTRYPDLLLETCAGGGGRFDAGMLYYSPQIWTSDNTDAVDRLRIQYGTSFGYPISAMGSHVSVCPNHQTGRTVPFETRALVASSGTFGFELDLEKMTEEEKKIAKEAIALYKKTEHLVQSADYYRLSSPYRNQDYVVWEFVSKDKKEALVQGVMLRNESNPHIHIIYMAGLKKDALYRNVDDGKEYLGAALMKAGLPLIPGQGDYQPIRFHFEMVEEA